MESVQAKKGYLLRRFLISPSGKGYFIPQSLVKRKTFVKRKLKNESKKVRYDSKLCNFRDYFSFLDRESPTNCRIVRLEPLHRDKSEGIINKSEGNIITTPEKVINKSAKLIIKAERIVKIPESPTAYSREEKALFIPNSRNISTEVSFSKEKPKIYLPTIKYTA